jgi:hypothetical protein
MTDDTLIMTLDSGPVTIRLRPDLAPGLRSGDHPPAA